MRHPDPILEWMKVLVPLLAALVAFGLGIWGSRYLEGWKINRMKPVIKIQDDVLLKTSYCSNFSLHPFIYNMFVVPIHFSKEHRKKFAYAKKLMEYGSGVVAINPKHIK